ncbi:MAG: tyrosine-type recombinase/integrase [Deltaproteobacteria bacterium]
MSSLYPRGRRIWIAYSDKFRKRRFKPTPFRVPEQMGEEWPRDVLHWQRKFDASLELGNDPFRKARGIKVTDAVEQYLEDMEGRLAPATIRETNLALEKFRSCFGAIDVAAISKDDIKRWVKWLRLDHPVKRGTKTVMMKISEQTIAKTLRSISPVFTWLESEGMIEHSPFSRFVKINPPKRPIVTLTGEQITQAFSLLTKPMRDRYGFLLLSGFRSDESSRVKWDDVDFSEAVIRIWNAKAGKGGDWSYFPMDEELLAFMAALPREYAPFVFKPYNASYISRAFTRIKEKLGWNSLLKTHTFRANFISALVNSGLSESVVMHLARHKSIQTTHKYYTAFDQGTMREELARSRKKKKTD